MQTRGAFLLVTLLAAACVPPASPPGVYRAVVESVTDMPGRHYSVAWGEQPLAAVCLRLEGPPGSEQELRLKVLAAGLYRPDQLGRPGDEVTFRYGGRLPLAGQVWIEQLRDYRVAVRGDPPAPSH